MNDAAKVIPVTNAESAPRALGIAYIGPASGTSLHRARAMERLGHHVTLIDPMRYLPDSSWTSRWLHHLGGLGVGLAIDEPVIRAVGRAAPSLIWVDQGAFLGRRLLRHLRGMGAPIVNYTIDDPFGGRDGRRFARYLNALPCYDLLAVVREENVAEAYHYGARRVIRVWMSADEVAHRPRVLTAEDRAKWGSEVCFVGTWMPERGPFMAKLIHAGIPLSIWGDRWEKAPEWPAIKAHWRGPSIYEDDYAKAIQLATVSLGLLSKGNRDRHTTRSMEIPSLGGVLCAERTDEHLLRYTDGEEAVFWIDADDCAEKCKRILVDKALRRRIASAGKQRYSQNNIRNETIVSFLINSLAVIPEAHGRHGDHSSRSGLGR